MSAVILFCTCWMTAALADPDWVLGEKSLSRMGISDVPLTANLFNIACITCGGLGLVPAVSKTKHSAGIDRLSGVLLVMGCISLMCVGIVQINDAVDVCLHDVFAFMFFGSAMSALVTSIVADLRSGHVRYGAVTLGSVVLFFIAYFTTQFGVYEAIGVLGIMVWMALQSVRILESPDDPEPSA